MVTGSAKVLRLELHDDFKEQQGGACGGMERARVRLAGNYIREVTGQMI